MGKEMLGRRRRPSEVGRTRREEAEAPSVRAQAPQVGDFQQRRKAAGLHSRQRSGETLVLTGELGDPFYPTRTPCTAHCTHGPTGLQRHRRHPLCILTSTHFPLRVRGTLAFVGCYVQARCVLKHIPRGGWVFPPPTLGL